MRLRVEPQTITLEWIARETGKAFNLAMGKRKTRLRDSINTAAFRIAAHIALSPDIDVMRGRAIRAGRALADEAIRKRLKVFTQQELPFQYGTRAVNVTSKEQGVSLRVIEQLDMKLDCLYRADILGARR